MYLAMPKVASAMTPAAPNAPMSRACWGLPPSLVRTKKVPTIEQTIPAPAMTRGMMTGPTLASARNGVEAERQDHRADDRTDEGLEKVGAHAGDVTDVVTDVVGDDSGVAGVILGEAGLDLADEVGADVRGLGVDAAADTREERDRGGTHRESGDDVDRAGELPAENVHEDEVEHAETDGRQTDDGHAHDGAAGERNVERRR